MISKQFFSVSERVGTGAPVRENQKSKPVIVISEVQSIFGSSDIHSSISFLMISLSPEKRLYGSGFLSIL